MQVLVNMLIICSAMQCHTYYNIAMLAPCSVIRIALRGHRVSLWLGQPFSVGLHVIKCPTFMYDNNDEVISQFILRGSKPTARKGDNCQFCKVGYCAHIRKISSVKRGKGMCKPNILRAEILDVHPTIAMNTMTSLDKHLRSRNIYTQFISDMKVHRHFSC